MYLVCILYSDKEAHIVDIYDGQQLVGRSEAFRTKLSGIFKLYVADKNECFSFQHEVQLGNTIIQQHQLLAIERD